MQDLQCILFNCRSLDKSHCSCCGVLLTVQAAKPCVRQMHSEEPAPLRHSSGVCHLSSQMSRHSHFHSTFMPLALLLPLRSSYHVSIPWPGPSILHKFSLVLSFLWAAISKFAKQRIRRGWYSRGCLDIFSIKVGDDGFTLLCGLHPCKADPSAGPAGVSQDPGRDDLAKGLQHALQLLLIHGQWQV